MLQFGRMQWNTSLCFYCLDSFTWSDFGQSDDWHMFTLNCGGQTFSNSPWQTQLEASEPHLSAQVCSSQDAQTIPSHMEVAKEVHKDMLEPGASDDLLSEKKKNFQPLADHRIKYAQKDHIKFRWLCHVSWSNCFMICLFWKNKLNCYFHESSTSELTMFSRIGRNRN